MFHSFARNIKQFLTALVLLLVGVVLAEIVLQIRSAPPASTVTSRVSSELQPLLAPSATIHHEMLRLSRQQTGAESTIITNSLGLRGDEPVQPKPDGLVRIVILGDETILGPRLPVEFTVTARLQEFLTKATAANVEVVNAGVPGYCPLLSWLQYRHQLQQLNPDLIILHFDMTDVSDDAFYRRALKDGGEHQICVNASLAANQSALNPLARMLRNSALLRLLQTETGLGSDPSTPGNAFGLQERYAWTTATPSDLRLQIQHAVDPIERFGKSAGQGSLQLLVSTVPTPWQVASADDFPALSRSISIDTGWPVTPDLPSQILDAICNRSSIRFCNATNSFRSFSQPAKLFAGDSTRLSAVGSLLYAREIASMLLQDAEFARLISAETSLSETPHALH